MEKSNYLSSPLDPYKDMISEKIPSLMELHVLSPSAWVKEEQHRMKAREDWPTDYPGIRIVEMAEQISNQATIITGPSDEDRRRQLEYLLIQISAMSVSWLEDLRKT